MAEFQNQDHTDYCKYSSNSRKNLIIHEILHFNLCFLRLAHVFLSGKLFVLTHFRSLNS